MSNNLFESLNERGLIYQMTQPEKIEKLINGKPITFYIGIDPTADSLHIGHFFSLMMFRRMQRAGHKGILLLGGATGMVGDPSFKNDMRKMMNKEQVQGNVDGLYSLITRFIDVDGDNPAIIVNNADWIDRFNYLEFMRTVGVHFNVNKMLASDAYATRLASGGLTFLEMGYMLMQAYDFVYLNRNYNCVLEIGGSDQWGNIVAGTELSRKMNVKEGGSPDDRPLTYGLTCPLLMTKDGKKMGKTESGTLWIAKDKTSPFTFYQYFYNTDDADTEMLLKVFTDIPVAEIKEMCQADIIAAKKRMAYEITALVHGKDEADKAVDAAKALFGQGTDLSQVPSVAFDKAVLQGGINVVELMTQTGFFESKGEVRRKIEQGGVYVDGKKITDANAVIKPESDKDYVLLQKGKKNFLKVTF